MTTFFNERQIQISSNSPVFKSEDGANYFLLFSGGNYSDSNICLPSDNESPNYYFYSGDGTVHTVQCKTY